MDSIISPGYNADEESRKIYIYNVRWAPLHRVTAPAKCVQIPEATIAQELYHAVQNHSGGRILKWADTLGIIHNTMEDRRAIAVAVFADAASSHAACALNDVTFDAVYRIRVKRADDILLFTWIYKLFPRLSLALQASNAPNTPMSTSTHNDPGLDAPETHYDLWGLRRFSGLATNVWRHQNPQTQQPGDSSRSRVDEIRNRVMADRGQPGGDAEVFAESNSMVDEMVRRYNIVKTSAPDANVTGHETALATIAQETFHILQRAHSQMEDLARRVENAPRRLVRLGLILPEWAYVGGPRVPAENRWFRADAERNEMVSEHNHASSTRSDGRPLRERTRKPYDGRDVEIPTTRPHDRNENRPPQLNARGNPTATKSKIWKSFSKPKNQGRTSRG